MAPKKRTHSLPRRTQVSRSKSAIPAARGPDRAKPAAARRKKPGKRRKNSATRLRLLFTCVGRRIELLNAFRRAAAELGLRLEIHGADASAMSPGFHRVDKAHLVPTIASGQYVNALLELVRKEKIGLLIPLIDTELPAIAAAVERFTEIGCRAVISSSEVVQICADKLETHRILSENGIDTPQTWTWQELLRIPESEHRFPYFMKPRAGSAAKGNYLVRNLEELRTFGRLVDDPIVQEFVDGVEHTLDVYAGFDGVPRCVVPRRRLEVRTGEVSKSLVVKNAALIAVGLRVAEVLGECRGVVTVQCMKTPRERIRVIEINPRFGGGAPLAIHAGADFPKWILQEHLGRKPRIAGLGFRDDVAMLRYDESVFVHRASRFLGSDKGKVELLTSDASAKSSPS
jgi:carbamoyl-phosphate synthase large subunit